MVHHLLADDTSEKTRYTTFMPPPSVRWGQWQTCIKLLRKGPVYVMLPSRWASDVVSIPQSPRGRLRTRHIAQRSQDSLAVLPSRNQHQVGLFGSAPRSKNLLPLRT